MRERERFDIERWLVFAALCGMMPVIGFSAGAIVRAIVRLTAVMQAVLEVSK